MPPSSSDRLYFLLDNLKSTIWMLEHSANERCDAYACLQLGQCWKGWSRHLAARRASSSFFLAALFTSSSLACSLATRCAVAAAVSTWKQYGFATCDGTNRWRGRKSWILAHPQAKERALARRRGVASGSDFVTTYASSLWAAAAEYISHEDYCLG